MNFKIEKKFKNRKKKENMNFKLHAEYINLMQNHQHRPSSESKMYSQIKCPAKMSCQNVLHVLPKRPAFFLAGHFGRTCRTLATLTYMLVTYTTKENSHGIIIFALPGEM